MKGTRIAIAAIGVLTACAAEPQDVAARYVVAREHGHGQEAYDLLSRPDRGGQSYPDFLRRHVQPIDERVVRVLARRTKVQAGPTTVSGARAQVRVEVLRVNIDEATRHRLTAQLQSGGPELASRLQKLDLPTRTSTETVRLVRETAGWRVRLNAP